MCSAQLVFVHFEANSNFLSNLLKITNLRSNQFLYAFQSELSILEYFETTNQFLSNLGQIDNSLVVDSEYKLFMVNNQFLSR